MWKYRLFDNPINITFSYYFCLRRSCSYCNFRLYSICVCRTHTRRCRRAFRDDEAASWPRRFTERLIYHWKLYIYIFTNRYATERQQFELPIRFSCEDTRKGSSIRWSTQKSIKTCVEWSFVVSWRVTDMMRWYIEKEREKDREKERNRDRDRERKRGEGKKINTPIQEKNLYELHLRAFVIYVTENLV